MMPPQYHGLLVIDKASGMTSRDVVNRALGWFPRRTRVGHTGTLDPLASGVLVLCVGAATRLTEYVQRMSKVYSAGIVLGAVSDTDDADGVVTSMPNISVPTREQLESQLCEFLGTIKQTPPAYSAAKVTGRRAYDLARQGAEFDLEPRRVTVHAIDVVRYDYPHLDIVVRCGKGTYIRSLARDLGNRLGCGGFIASLRRTQVGTFTVADAITLQAEPDEARQRLLPLARAVCELPALTLGETDAFRIASGQHIAAPDGLPVGEAAIFLPDGRLLAVVDIARGTMHARKVFVTRARKDEP